ncbi:MAG: hypothetical protein ACI3VU_00120 [Faecousia sp.]
MKRVKAACICQTLHFMRKEELGQTEASVQEEVKRYKQSLDRSRTQYKILEETLQPDGSVILKLKKQYNQSPVGEYFN